VVGICCAERFKLLVIESYAIVRQENFDCFWLFL
jgi:hypothetical protein